MENLKLNTLLKLQAKLIAQEIKDIKKEIPKVERARRYYEIKLKDGESKYTCIYLFAGNMSCRKRNCSEEARIIHLARAFLKNTPYKAVESKTKKINTNDINYREHRFKTVIIPEIVEKINKFYLRKVTEEEVLNWVNK